MSPTSTLTPSTDITSKASYSQAHGIHILRLKGSFYEMGYQHGHLLKEHIPNGPINYFRYYLERIISGSNVSFFAPIAYPLMRQFLAKRVARKMPDFAIESIRGLADGSGLPYQQIMDGCTMPDSLLAVVSQLMRFKKTAQAVDHRIALGLGCTSAVAWNGATTDGRLLHARNLDYYACKSWPTTSTVAFHEPEQGQKYVSACAAGVLMGGVTAMNEAGLSLTVHQHMFTDRARLGGVPIGLVGDEIMRKAENLDDAQKILGQQKPIGCWTYVITNAHTKEVLCWEENPERNAAFRYGPEDESFGYANIYLDKELGQTEKALYGSYWRHNTGRYRRVQELLKQHHGQLDATGMASILGDTGDSSCRMHEAICMLMTVASVVFRPEDGTLWLGKGLAPTSQGEFIPFSLKTQDYAPEHDILNVGPDAEAPESKAFQNYRDSYLAYFDDADLEKSQECITVTCEQQPEQPIYHYIAGLVAIKRLDSEAALKFLNRALDIGHPTEERRAAFLLWRGRAHDLAGDRSAAKADYQASLELKADDVVHAAARYNSRRAYKKRWARKIGIDFAMADVMKP